jgi:hypothetical protein
VIAHGYAGLVLLADLSIPVAHATSMSLSQHVKQQGSRGTARLSGRMAWSRSFAAFLAMGICVIASIK